MTDKTNAKKHIELFPGSIQDLERMTGKQYEAMKNKDNNLLKVFGQDYTAKDVESCLGEKALEIGADALVNVQYIPHDNHNSATGYAVKEILKPYPKSF